jgi:hypothetical protein
LQECLTSRSRRREQFISFGSSDLCPLLIWGVRLTRFMPPELQGPYVPAAIIFVVGSFFTVSAVWDLIDGVRSYEWPSVEGRTVDHAISFGASKHRVDDSLVFAYAYTVNGVQYQGARFDFAGRNSISRSRELLAEYGVGSRVRVFYDPKRPDRAVLEPGVGTWTVVPVLLGGLVAVITGSVTRETIAILLSR